MTDTPKQLDIVEWIERNCQASPAEMKPFQHQLERALAKPTTKRVVFSMPRRHVHVDARLSRLMGDHS